MFSSFDDFTRTDVQLIAPDTDEAATSHTYIIEYDELDGLEVSSCNIVTTAFGDRLLTRDQMIARFGLDWVREIEGLAADEWAFNRLDDRVNDGADEAWENWRDYAAE